MRGLFFNTFILLKIPIIKRNDKQNQNLLYQLKTKIPTQNVQG
jgi:hypothetical protein